MQRRFPFGSAESRWRISWCVLLTAILLFLGTAIAQAAAEHLKVGLAALATSVDPHFHRAGYNFDLRENVSDALVYNNGVTGEIEPRLALSWAQTSETTVVLQLNPKAVFPTGDVLTSDDVIYSLCRVRNVPNSPGLFTSFIKTVEAVTALGDHEIEIETAAPDPILLRNLSQIGIVENPTDRTLSFDKQTCGNNDWLKTTAINKGTIAPGIGPYQVEKFTPDVEIILTRNESYYGPRPHFAKVTLKALPDNSARIAALLGGSVDVINQLPVNGADVLIDRGGFQIVTVPSTVLIFLLADQYQEPSPKISRTGGKNPFKDRRVRRALNLAIDRLKLAEIVMGGFANPAHQIVVDGIQGFDPDIESYPFDVQQARDLLAEAGYADGFKLTLSAPSDRYVNGPLVAQAVVGMLTKIGLDVELETFPKSIYFSQASKYEYSLYLAGAAVDTGEGSSILLNIAGSRDLERGSGGANRGRYSSAVFDDLISEALSTLDDTEREALLKAASRTARDDESHVPLYHELGVWAVREGIYFEPNPNLRNIFYTARTK
ncbi:MAG: ABC transporter substrate-binding protein [Pseudomonadota bacterium]